MSRQTTIEGQPAGQGRKWVRTFLFSMRIDSPLAGLHVITKGVLVVGMSLAVLGMISTTHPDPVGCVLLAALALVLLWLSGVLKWLYSSYLVMIYPMLLSLFATWLVFNPDPGNRVLFSHQVYSGEVHLGVSVAMILFLAIAVAYYLCTKQLLWGILGGAVAAILTSQTSVNLSWTFASFPLHKPLTLMISDKTVLTAGTKVIGYFAMVLLTFLLVLTTRDVDVIGALRKVPRMPYGICLFSSLMLRSLDIAVLDFTTIRQAQVARGINARKKNILAKLRDYAYVTVPLIATMMRRSIEISDALIVRGYERGSNPTVYREVRPLRALDWLLIVGTVLFVAAVRWINMTEIAANLVLG